MRYFEVAERGEAETQASRLYERREQIDTT